MARIAILVDWEMGHRLPNHHGKCFNLHGHRYEAEVVVEGIIRGGHKAPDEGMVVDFTDLKGKVKAITQGLWDHKTMIFEDDPYRAELEKLPGVIIVPIVPTAENIARRLYQKMNSDMMPLAQHSYRIVKVIVRETANSWAEYSGE